MKYARLDEAIDGYAAGTASSVMRAVFLGEEPAPWAAGLTRPNGPG